MELQSKNTMNTIYFFVKRVIWGKRTAADDSIKAANDAAPKPKK